VIDPIHWDPSYTSENAFPKTPPKDGSLDGTWEYEDLKDDEDLDYPGQTKVGVWRRLVDGEVVQEVNMVRTKRPRSDAEAVDEDEQIHRSDSPLFDETRDTRAVSPLFGNSRLQGDTSALSDAHAAPSTSSISSCPSEHPAADGSPSQPQNGYVVSSSIPSSPLFPVRNTRPPAMTEKFDPLLRYSSIPDPLLEQVRAERSAALEVIGSLLGEVTFSDLDEEIFPKRRKEWAGLSEIDEEEEEPLRLRGGAGSSSSSTSRDSEEEEEDASQESSAEESSPEGVPDETSGSSSESEVEVDEGGVEHIEEEDATKDNETPAKAKTSALKSLFAPSASGQGIYSTAHAS